MATASYATSTLAGATVSLVGGDPTTFDATGFAALTWVPIGKIKSLNLTAAQWQEVTSSYLSQTFEEVRKGTRKAGGVELKVDIKSDTGQTLCKTAVDSRNEYNLKVAYSNGVVQYRRVLVMSFSQDGGDANAMNGATLSLTGCPFPSGEDYLVEVEPTTP